jgi:hypothetical protein
MLYIGLLWSHDLRHGFARLIHVNQIYYRLNIFFF